jgi:hypothetical protein
VLETQEEPGVQSKRVCRKIRLIKELTINGDNNTGCSNTGDKNTGDSNTGDSNTGNWNTGYKNVGNWNTGNRNVGNRNVGNWNTGDSNTGNRNTGDDNTGDNNTGDWNTGDKNTGNSNTGNRNTGSWNHCNCNSGFFGSIDPKVTSFDLPTDYSQSEFWENFSNLIRRLGDLLLSDDPIDVKPFLQIPNITQERLDNLHQKFIKSRQKENEKI